MTSKSKITLNDWLSCQKRDPCPYSKFNVIDLEEIYYSEEIENYLTEIIYDQIFDIKLLKHLAEELGWDRVKDEFISPSIPPEGSTIKKGDFGEILFSGILEEFQGYSIPFYKVHYKFIAEQSLPRTDILALKIEDDKVIEVCFIESKLRMSKDVYAAKKGSEQLYADYNIKLPDILKFTVKILNDKKSELLNPFIKYLLDRKINTNLDNFRLSLCWEKKLWDEKALKTLESHEIQLSKLNVHVICIDDLDIVINNVFSELEDEGMFDDR
jgi:hypothetical protein